MSRGLSHLGADTHTDHLSVKDITFPDGSSFSTATSSDAYPLVINSSQGNTDAFKINSASGVDGFKITESGNIQLQDVNNFGGEQRFSIAYGGVNTFEVLSSGAVYSATGFFPSDSSGTIGNSGQFFTGVFTNTINFQDGTSMTTAPVVPQVPFEITHTNTQAPTASWTESNIFTDSTKTYMVEVRDIRFQGTGDLELNFYSGTNNIVNGDVCIYDLRSGTSGAQTIIAGVQSIILNESAQAMNGATLGKVNIEFYQRTGSRGHVVIECFYLNGSFRSCSRKQVYVSNGTQITGLNLRAAGGSNIQGSIQVIKKS